MAAKCLPIVRTPVGGTAAPATGLAQPTPRARAAALPSLVLLEVSAGPEGQEKAATPGSQEAEVLPLTAAVAARIPYVVSALSAEWRRPGGPSDPFGMDSGAEVPEGMVSCARVQVFLPEGCPVSALRAVLCRLAAEADGAAEQGLAVSWRPVDLASALRLAQVASMLQVDDLMPELAGLVRGAVATVGDLAVLEATCHRLELPAALREVAAAARRVSLEPAGLPDEAQVRGMIASALLTADGKVWRVVQKVIDRREAWPRLANENAAALLDFATGAHGSIRATPHTGFFWGSRDFLYLVCRYIRGRPDRFHAMVSAMFDSVYSMDPELPAEIIDAVFKELLVHEGLSFAQCEHVIAKLMQRPDQLEYLFHEWSGVFPTLPPNARRALSKGLLPAVGRCPHAALDFVLKELEAAPLPPGTGLNGAAPTRLWRGLLRFPAAALASVMPPQCCAARRRPPEPSHPPVSPGVGGVAASAAGCTAALAVAAASAAAGALAAGAPVLLSTPLQPGVPSTSPVQRW